MRIVQCGIQKHELVLTHSGAAQRGNHRTFPDRDRGQTFFELVVVHPLRLQTVQPHATDNDGVVFPFRLLSAEAHDFSHNFKGFATVAQIRPPQPCEPEHHEKGHAAEDQWRQSTASRSLPDPWPASNTRCHRPSEIAPQIDRRCPQASTTILTVLSLMSWLLPPLHIPVRQQRVYNFADFGNRTPRNCTPPRPDPPCRSVRLRFPKPPK